MKYIPLLLIFMRMMPGPVCSWSQPVFVRPTQINQQKQPPSTTAPSSAF